MFQRLFRNTSPGLVIRYLVVGVWNTLFGYGLYALLTYLLTPLIPAAYMVASFFGSIIAISVSFLGHRVFVFRSKGHFWKEYFRCFVVYGTTNLVGFAILPVLVFVLRRWFLCDESAPYIAGALLTGASVVISFFGHKEFTFANPSSSDSDSP